MYRFYQCNTSMIVKSKRSWIDNKYESLVIETEYEEGWKCTNKSGYEIWVKDDPRFTVEKMWCDDHYHVYSNMNQKVNVRSFKFLDDALRFSQICSEMN